MSRMVGCCSATILENLCLDSRWYTIIKHCNHVRMASMRPDNQNCVKDQPDNIWDILERDGVNIHDLDTFIKKAEKNREFTISRPNDIYIFDEEEHIADEHVKQIGTLNISSNTINVERLIDQGWFKDPILGKKFSWKDFFTGYHIDPVQASNAMVIIDRYLFSEDKEHKLNYLNGVRNIFDILDEVLPSTFKSDYHILIIFDAKKLEKKTSFEQIVEGMKSVKRNLDRPYHVIIELLSISNDCVLYSETHDRRILSNYYRITATHGFSASAPFAEDERKLSVSRDKKFATCSQTIYFDPIYKGIGNKRQDQNELPINACNSIISIIKNIIAEAVTGQKGIQYINIESGSRNIKKIKNRLLRD